MTNARLAVNLGIFAAIVGGLVWLGTKDEPKATKPRKTTPARPARRRRAIVAS